MQSTGIRRLRGVCSSDFTIEDSSPHTTTPSMTSTYFSKALIGLGGFVLLLAPVTRCMMTKLEPDFLMVGQGDARRPIAFLQQESESQQPGVLWFPGFKSEMMSTKADALADWAQSNGRAYTRFDYSGHGKSGGRFEDGTISRWLEEATAIFHKKAIGKQILVGSSMGGYIALLLLRNLIREDPESAACIHALVLIAPAWDMTEEILWKNFADDVRRSILIDGCWLRPSIYDDGSYPISLSLIQDGRKHLLLTQEGSWNPGRPVRILHGCLDPDVPLAHSERLLSSVLARESDVILTKVPDGDHRLSRKHDLALLLDTIQNVSIL
jgi:pimeloyl-ACP methyl ester carboxylesterase